MKPTVKVVKKQKKNASHLEDDIVKKIDKLKSKRGSNGKSKGNDSNKNNVGKSNENSKRNKVSGPNTDDVVEDSSADESSLKPTSLLLKDVMDLGGTEDDFDLLKAVSDNEAELEVDSSSNSQFDFAELMNFMKTNGIKTVKKAKAKKAVNEVTPIEVKEEKTITLIVPSNPTPHTQLIFKVNEPWYTNVPASKSGGISPDLGKWTKYAEQLWQNEVKLSGELRDKHQSADQQWMKTVFSGGTTNDKVSAHCLLLQESPVHHVGSLEALLGMGKKKSKRLAIQAIDSLKEMFLSTILPDSRKLLSFPQHDFSVLKGKDIESTVLGWFVEDRLKSHYSDFIEILQSHLSDNEVAIRTKLSNIIYQLLNEKPEKEQELLSIIVNKIGDPDNKLASKIIYILGQLLKNHPSMKLVVSSEVERVLFRPNIAERAQYYSVCFLNQLQLSAEDSGLAAHLIEIYFKFFRESIESKNLDSRMLGGLLTGVNRSYPYTAERDGITEENVNTLFKLVYIGNFNVSVQALMLLYQVSGNKTDICNRYYQALYSKLVDSSVHSSSKKTFLLNLIYKSLKRDDNVVRKVAIARRLLQISNLDDPVLACASLYTISEANKQSNSEPAPKSTAKISVSKPPPDTPGSLDSEEAADGTRKEGYDAKGRNPLYSNADKEDLWEFSLLSRNFHPTVNQFVSTLLTEGDISYNGDPFNDFTRTKFFDKFVFKNPKKGVSASDKKFYTRNKISSKVPQVYSSDFKDQKSNKIHADEQFFYDYFKVKEADKNEEKTEQGDVDAKLLDFVDDIKFSAASKPSKNKKKTPGDDSEEEDVSDSDSEFSYGDIDEEDDDTEQLTEKAYEKFLWENLDSEGESLKGSDDEEDVSNAGRSNHVGESSEDSDVETKERSGDEDEWEDIGVGDSDSSNDAVYKESSFLEADQLDSIILDDQSKNKKRKIGSDKEKSVSRDSKKKKTKGKIKN